ncbi:PREDICTED: uncharacterized protein LOC106812847 [Priapulus caudatus]|uniref:Uncharacterized protein LOC106812847 n=1 Tax=Priapulus caudatus TaxID=37621 RepID=A0ABM1EJE4_PRICU|nr:PREDICTED: uncharacterized protein LOC106812847 [Priapulus caudatus]
MLPSLPVQEKQRIESVGGAVKPKSGVHRVVWQRPKQNHRGPIRRSTELDHIPFLAVARSLGDLWSYDYARGEFAVSPEPDTHVLAIEHSRHRCLILASDGLWNMLSPLSAAAVVEQAERMEEEQYWQKSNGSKASFPNINPSCMLVDKTMGRWRKRNLRADNTSVVTVMLDPQGPSRSTVLQRHLNLLRLRKRNGSLSTSHLVLTDPSSTPKPKTPPQLPQPNTLWHSAPRMGTSSLLGAHKKFADSEHSAFSRNPFSATVLPPRGSTVDASEQSASLRSSSEGDLLPPMPPCVNPNGPITGATCEQPPIPVAVATTRQTTVDVEAPGDRTDSPPQPAAFCVSASGGGPTRDATLVAEVITVDASPAPGGAGSPVRPTAVNKVILPAKYKQRLEARAASEARLSSGCGTPQGGAAVVAKPLTDQDWTWNIDFDCGEIVEIEREEEEKATTTTLEEARDVVAASPRLSAPCQGRGVAPTMPGRVGAPARRLARSRTLGCAVEARQTAGATHTRRMVLRQKSVAGVNSVMSRVSDYVMRRDAPPAGCEPVRVFAAHNSEDKRPALSAGCSTAARKACKRKLSHASQEAVPAKHRVTRSLIAKTTGCNDAGSGGRKLTKKPSLLQLGRQKLLRLTTRSKYNLH